MYEYKIDYVKKINDGDTISTKYIDLGFDQAATNKSIRLTGIDTPESRTSDKKEKVLGLKAKQFLINLIESISTPVASSKTTKSNRTYRWTSYIIDKGTLILKSHGFDKYGRVLGELWIESTDNPSISQLLMEADLARPYFGGSKNELGPWTKEENGIWYRYTNNNGYVEIEE